MDVGLQQTFNAADVADAIFSSMLSHREWDASGNAEHDNHETLQILITSIDDGLKAAGLSFAEYLERVRHTREMSIPSSGQRWRFSARERAVQRVDSAVAHLCSLMQHA